MSDTMNTEIEPAAKRDGWKGQVRPALSYLVALGLTLTAPALIAGAVILAVLAGDASIVGLGLLAGALLGAVGALALLWLLSDFRGRRQPEAG